jgi:thioredoxin reductase
VNGRPHPPGSYDVVVVGSGPGGLQTSYCLARLGIRHAVLSADDSPGGMFRKWPIFQRLISWTKLDPPAERTSHEYERYDQNSLLADEPERRSLVAAAMSGAAVYPARPEMERALVGFAAGTGVPVRYGCRWEATRREGDRIVLETTDGEYTSRFVVFALGVTVPWKSAIPGIDAVPHYSETRDPERYRGRRVVVIGKRNSGFEIAHALMPWARGILLVSPRPMRTAVLAHASIRVRYYQPLEDVALGGGTFALDAVPTRIERTVDGWRVDAEGTTVPGELGLDADDVIAATGFSTPLGDLPDLGVTTVADGRIPALTPFWESISASGIFFAGNASQGARGLRKHGAVPRSTALEGFRYNARLLARHLAERLGVTLERPPLGERDVPALLARSLARAPELWSQKGYLARTVVLDGTKWRDAGFEPLALFVDAPGPDALAVTVEVDTQGTIYPCVYVRRRGSVAERPLDPDLLHAFDAPRYERDLAALLQAA